MILKLIAGILLSVTSFAAAFQYGGIKHDITSQTATSAVIVMNAASTQVQRVTGSSAQDIKLPDATKLRSGYWYRIVNESTGSMTIRNSSSTLIGSLAAGSTSAPKYANLYLTSNSTSGGPWTFESATSSALSPSGVTPGSYTSANITVDTNGIVTAAANGSGGSSVVDAAVYVDSPTGYGSTNTMIRIFGRTVKNTGGAYITYNTSATNGDNFTIGTAGMYAICYGDYRNNSMALAITVNDSAMTTVADTPITYAQGLRALYTGASLSDYAQVCDVTDLAVNDVVRAHSNGTNTATDQTGYFYIIYLGAQSGKEFYVDDPAGYGSTNTLIRTYTASAASVRVNTGSNYTFTQSSTNGDTITILSDGLYWVCRNDQRSSSGVMDVGVSVNATGGSITSGINTLTFAEGRRFYAHTALNYYTQTGQNCGPLNLSNGDVLRAHEGTGLANVTNAKGSFKIIKMGSTKTAAYLDTGAGHGSTFTKIRRLGNIRDIGTSALAFGNSAVSGSSFTTYSTGVHVGCMQDYMDSTASGILLNPRIGTVSITTPLEFNDGFRGYRLNGSSSSTSQACAFDILGPNGNIALGDDGAATNTSIYINMTAAKIN